MIDASVRVAARHDERMPDKVFRWRHVKERGGIIVSVDNFY